jgi:hypothetical protein
LKLKLPIHVLADGRPHTDAQVAGMIGLEAVRIVSFQIMSEAANVVYHDGQGNLQSQILFRDKETELELPG